MDLDSPAIDEKLAWIHVASCFFLGCKEVSNFYQDFVVDVVSYLLYFVREEVCYVVYEFMEENYVFEPRCEVVCYADNSSVFKACCADVLAFGVND